MKKYFLLYFLTLSLAIQAQQTLTTFGGWNTYVHLPNDYNNGQNKIYPVIIAFVGLGEVGTDPSKILLNSPSSYINNGWNGIAVVNGDSTKFIVLTMQPTSAYPSEANINSRIALVKAAYRCGDITLTGPSHGGWCANTYVTGDAYGGPYTYVSQIKNVVEVQGVIPDDNSPYPNLFDNFALAAPDKFFLGFEQSNDNRGMPTRVNRMNAARSGTARMLTTTYGGGPHGYFNRYYGGTGTTPVETTPPTVFTIDGIEQDLYQWIARHSRRDFAPVTYRQYIITTKKYL